MERSCRLSLAMALLAWSAVYAALLLVTSAVLHAHAVMPASVRAVIGLAPMIAGCGILGVYMRLYRAVDELQQRIFGESLIFAVAATVMIMFSYQSLQHSIGAPPLAIESTLYVLAGTWLLGSVITRRRYR